LYAVIRVERKRLDAVMAGGDLDKTGIGLRTAL
jgi:hypothetical protein